MSATPHDAPPPAAGRPDVPASYGLASASEGELLPWAWADARLAAARNYWVITVRPDGRPHAMPVWGVWMDGAFCFGTGTDSRKGRNLAADPRAVVHLESGDEVVVLEGVATLLTDAEDIQRLDAALNAKYAMAAGTEDLELEDLGAVFYRLSPQVAFGWTEANFPQNATRWVFSG